MVVQVARFQATIREEVGWKQFSVSVVGQLNGVSRQVTVNRVYLPTFANYAMWSEVNGVIYYFPGEEFWGLIHSNDRLWFSSSSEYGGPIFNDQVSSSDSTVGGNTNWVTFRDGFELDAEAGSLSAVDFDFLKDRAGIVSGGIVLEGHTTIAINGSNLSITNERKGWIDHTVPISPNQLVYVADAADSGTNDNHHGRVYMQDSVLDGRVSIVTEEDVYIQGHVRYANDPSDDGFNDPDDDGDDDFSDDALGLISKDDVFVDLNAPDNLTLQAAILATGQVTDDNGSFGVLEWYKGSPRGDLNLYGSLVQEKRGYVNMSFGENAIVHGYRKRYSFDSRFENSSPPYYPEISNRVIFEGWSDGPGPT